MDQRKEQRLCIKFCANLGKSATETVTVIQQAFGDQSFGYRLVFVTENTEYPTPVNHILLFALCLLWFISIKHQQMHIFLHLADRESQYKLSN